MISNNINFLKTKNNLFLFTFFISAITYLTYLAFRGFGWDGDSFISASQFIKIINHDLYESAIDGGAHPKFFTVILFGSIYQITGGFYLLTILSIILNSLMIGTIAKWLNEEKGLWLVAVFGLLINIPWTKIVINCDNPAFSIPFIVFGLYFISRDNYPLGALFLVSSNFFRSGSEFIIVLLIIYALFSKNHKNVLVLGIALTISLIHSYWGYLLIYPSREIFWNNAWKFRVSPDTIAEYQYSLKAIIPYVMSVVNQLLTKYSIIFIIPAVIGAYRIFNNRKTIAFAMLIPLDSLILPVSSFIYGTFLLILETKHMGYTILLPTLASFAINKNILNNINKNLRSGILLITVTIILLFNGYTGNLKAGDYESHTNGTGVIGWTNYKNIKKDIGKIFPENKINILTAYQYLTFVTLDLGKYANNISVVKTENEIDISNIDQYQLILIPKQWGLASQILLNTGFELFTSKHSYNYFISYIPGSL